MMEYLTDERDRVLLALTPTLMAPRFGSLPTLATGLHRFVVASNGLFLQARTDTLEVSLKVADTPTLPYGAVTESVHLIHGPIPADIGATIAQRCSESHPTEWAGVVLWNAQASAYQLHEPTIESASAGHIRYSTAGYDDRQLVVDVHSHGGGEAYFSQVDDESDIGGVYIASVMGRCASPAEQTQATRIVAHGIFYPVEWKPW